MVSNMRLVYLSSVPWFGLWQRPHEFASWFHGETGGPVLWLDPYPTRLPSLWDILRPRPRCNPNAFVLPSWLQVAKIKALPIEPLPILSNVNRLMWRSATSQVLEFEKQGPTILGVGRPSEFALTLLNKKSTPAFFDCVDNFEAFYRGMSARSMRRREKRIVEKCQLVVAASTGLRDRYKGTARVMLVRNACTSNLQWPVSREKAEREGPTVFGYIGTIGRWFDWQLVVKIALLFPKAVVRIIGPLHVNIPPDLPTNVEFLPPCSHSDALASIKEFSAGLIPFKVNQLTNYVDPIKYYEYRSSGIPVIATRFGEMSLHSRDRGLFLVDPNSDFSATISAALEWSCDIGEVQTFRSQNSWAKRFGESGLREELLSLVSEN